MSDERRDILTAVAEGRLSAEEAAERLEELDRLQAPEPRAETPVPGNISRIRVSARYCKVRVIGDPSVLEAVAEGPHDVRRDGDTLIIDSDEEGELGHERSWFRFGERSWSRVRERHLSVRVNPGLALEADTTAGSLWLTGTRAALRVEVFAGSARLEDVAGPLDIVTHAGSVHVRSRLERGASRIRCEAGSVNVQLEEGSSVRVRARSVLGRVLLPEPVGAMRGDSWGLSDSREVTIGGGAATLDIETNMGPVTLRTTP
jgi:SHOCT-like protein